MRTRRVLVACVLAVAGAGVTAAAQGSAPPSCSITLTVSNGTIADPGKVTCRRGSVLDFVVLNNDANADYTVTIDPNVIVFGNSRKHPFQEGRAGSARPRPRDRGTIRFHVRGNADAGTYKYTVTWSGTRSGTLDPDIEIAM